MPHNHDDDLGPLGGVGSNHHIYGGRARSSRNRSAHSLHDAQIEKAFQTVKDEAAGQSLNMQQLAHRLRLILRDEFDVFLSSDEAFNEVQKRHS